MKTAEVYLIENLSYKNGYVLCNCGWNKELGDGFNGYSISCCPKCNTELHIYTKNKVITGNPKGANLTAKVGYFVYFALSNGIHVQYSSSVVRTYHNLTERQADKL